MIRIRYTFTNADGRTAWNDFLSDKTMIADVLKDFATHGPKFMLKNLVDMRLFELVVTSHAPEEKRIYGIDSDITYFITKHKA